MDENAPRPDAPGPERVFQTLVAYQDSAALAAAIELDLFSAIGASADTPSKLALRIGAAERGARMLADRMVVQGFLEKGDGRYRLAPHSARFLDRRSPECIASIADFLCSPELRGAFDTLAEAARRGGTAWGEAGTVEAEHPAWVRFARGMAPLAHGHARKLAQLLVARVGAELAGSVLDVAAGHGWYGIELALRLPKTDVVALDWRPVLAVARENAAAAEVETRFRTLEGDAREVDLGGPHALALVVNWLHHFDLETCARFLARLRRAMLPGATLAVLELLVEEDRVAPPESAGFGVIMLATTPAGDCFTRREMTELLERAGFTDVAFETLPGVVQTAILARA